MKPPFGIEEIRQLLPHRYPFLLIDRVVELVPGERAAAIKNVSVNEPYFGGHFPSRPVMPGVLIVEGLAQTAAVLFSHDRDDREATLFYLTGIERARFRRPVVPGDQLRFEIWVERRRATFARFAGRALVDGAVVAEASFSSAKVDR